MTLFAVDRTTPLVPTSWMSPSPFQAPPGRLRPLAPGVLIFHPIRAYPASILDVGECIPAPDVEPVGRNLKIADWHDWALCAGMEQKRFFDEDRRTRVGSTAEARRICRACTVAEDCLLWALEKNEEFGVWAGTTGRQREAMQTRIKAGETTIEFEVRTWLRIT